MFKKCALFFFLLSSVFVGIAQEFAIDAKIAPDGLKEDFSIMITSLRDHHPGLYTFFPKNQFDSIAQADLAGLTDSLTESEFQVYVRKFLTKIRCGHTASLPSKAWYEYVKAQEKLIPIHVFLRDDELYVRTIFGDHNDEFIGSRIVSIDGNSAGKIVSEMKSITPRDGYGETMVDRNVVRLFQTYYLFLYGLMDAHTVELQLESGEVIQTSLEGQVGKRFNYKVSHELEDVIKTKTAKFGLLKDSSHTAVIALSSFSNKEYKKFYKRVFKRLAGMDSVDLIIDLRGNGGGYFPNGNELLRYLMPEKFTMDFSKSKKRSKKSKYLKMDIGSSITRFVFSTIPDRNKADSARNYQIRYKPIKRNHFNGDVYLLTDGLTFSTGSFVASKLKNGAGAKISGEETGGGEVGFNATLSWDLTLPNSAVRVIIPAYHVDVQPEMEDIGRGVMPNLEIER